MLKNIRNMTLLSMKESYFILFLIVVCGIYSCGKMDGSYYDYTNKIHSFEGTTYDFLQSQPGVFDSLLLVLDRFPELQDSLMNDSVTLIAPSNTSFTLALSNLNTVRQTQHLPALYISTLDSANMDTLICRYIIRGEITTSDVTPDKYIDGFDVYGIKYGYPMHFQYKKTNASGAVLAGPQSLIVSDTKKSYFTSAWVNTNTSSVDIFCKNGIVHTLVQSHIFGFGEFTSRLNK